MSLLDGEGEATTVAFYREMKGEARGGTKRSRLRLGLLARRKCEWENVASTSAERRLQNCYLGLRREAKMSRAKAGPIVNRNSVSSPQTTWCSCELRWHSCGRMACRFNSGTSWWTGGIRARFLPSLLPLPRSRTLVVLEFLSTSSLPRSAELPPALTAVSCG